MSKPNAEHVDNLGGSNVIESLMYEVLPFAYLVAGLGAILVSKSGFLTVSGILLLVASVTILTMRWTYRRRRAEWAPTHANAKCPMCGKPGGATRSH